MRGREKTKVQGKQANGKKKQKSAKPNPPIKSQILRSRQRGLSKTGERRKNKTGEVTTEEEANDRCFVSVCLVTAASVIGGGARMLRGKRLVEAGG